jgi:hypothetical protein
VEPKPQEPLLFASAEPEQECVPVPESDMDPPDLTSNEIKKSQQIKNGRPLFWEIILL